MIGCKGREDGVVAENISIIKHREEMDRNVSVKPYRNSHLKWRSGQERETGAVASSVSSRAAAKVLSSTPARIGGPEHSPELSSIHGSDAGGSMLVPRVVREILTEDMVEDETEPLGSAWYMLDEDDRTINYPANNKEEKVTKVTTKAVSCKPCPSSSNSDKSTLSVQSPGPATTIVSDSVGISTPAKSIALGSEEVADVRFMGDTIVSKLSQMNSDMSARRTLSRTGLSSEDTSGEIFSAVVHRNQTAMVVKYSNSAARSSAKEPIKKKFKLSSRNRAATQLSIFSKEEYYRGKPASERMFDEFMEEEEKV